MRELETNIERIFEKWRISSVTPGLAVGIHIDSKEYYYSYGLSSLSSKTPITKSTKFHIASLSKMLTAYIFRGIEQKGHLKGNEKISKYLPIDVFLKNPITFEHLLNHTSGLRDQWDLTRFSGWREHDPILQSDIKALLSNQTDLNFSPGKYYCYCNSGYTVLADIMEKVTGLKMEKLVTEYIKNEFEIQNTEYWSYKDTIFDFAYGYKLNEKGLYQLDLPQFEVIGSTSMYSTAEDLIRFNKQYIDKIKSANSDNLKALNPNSMLYQDGLIKGNLNGVYFELHSGWDYGYSSFLLRFPLHECSIVLLSNSGNADLLQHVVEIAELINPQFNFLPNKSLATIENSSLTPGTYLNEDSNTLHEVSVQNKNIYINGSAPFLLNDKILQLPNSLNTIHIKEDASFEVVSINSSLKYRRIVEIEIDAFEKYLGRYYSKELNVYFDIVLIDNDLYLKRPKFVETKLMPKTKNCFLAKDCSIFFDISDDIVAGFSLSTSRSWNIRFEKKDTGQAI